MADDKDIIYQKAELSDKEAIRIIQLKSAPKNQPAVDCHLLRVSPKDDIKKPGRRYEALSWCWGSYEATHDVRIHFEQEPIRIFKISESLLEALKAIRHVDRDRYLWVDAICINQGDPEEKARQVPRMDMIYGGAFNVCIWLGPSDDTSTLAIQFIEQQVLQLWNFDELCKSHVKEWDALIELMKRPWFSRRWIVQEIALARHATVYCGDDSISWYKFANAVALVVDEQTASRRLSEAVRSNSEYRNPRDYFGNVPTFGAALLVETTSYLFSTSPNGDRLRLSNLENLVSRSAIFATKEPRDIVYGLLAMAKDSNPGKRSDFTAMPSPAEVVQPVQSVPTQDDLPASGVATSVSQASQTLKRTAPLTRWEKLTSKLVRSKPSAKESSLSAEERRRLLDMVNKKLRSLESEPYDVDYKHSVLDVYRHFIAFSIRKSDPTRALDIICRPWAARITCEDEWKYLKMDHGGREVDKCKHPDFEPFLTKVIPHPSWMPAVEDAAFALDDEHRVRGANGSDGNGLFFTQGMRRVNADPLVGVPDSAMRRYAAAGTRTVDRKKIRFSRRILNDTEPWSTDNHYSMFVEGFVIDTVEVYRLPASQAGGIPRKWLSELGWDSGTHELPAAHFENFWRTLVADRGAKGNNPPLFYDLACREVLKRDRLADTIDTTKLIHDGHCSIVAEFLRRVQATIWGRKLFLTKGDSRSKGPRMGLACEREDKEIQEGDLVCILYGCSVPVILRRKTLSPSQVEKEQEYDAKIFKQKVQWAVDKIKEGKKKLAERNRLKRRKKSYWRRAIELAPTARMLFFLAMALYVWFAYRDPVLTAWFLGRLVISAIALLPFEAKDLGYGVHRWYERLTRLSRFEILAAAPIVVAVLAAVFELHLPWDRVGLMVGIEIFFGPPANLTSMFNSWWKPPKPTGDKSTQTHTEHFYYEFIGEAYVHGIMNGEAITWQNDSEVRARMFELR